MNLYYFWLCIRSAWCYMRAFIIALFFFIPLLILVAIIPPARRYQSTLLFFLLNMLYQGIIWAFMLDITIEGKEFIPHDRPAIIIANHESSLDIPALGSLVGNHPHLWYTWHRFFSIPIFGFIVRRMAISVHQDASITAAKSCIRGIKIAQQYKLHSLLFPEGGRYLDGKIHTFFSGFGMLAKKLQQPVVPVMIYHMGKVYPPSAVLIHPHPIRIRIGEPLMCGEHETGEQFVNRVREWFVNQRS